MGSLNPCGHNDCFTCPYKDCTVNGFVRLSESYYESADKLTRGEYEREYYKKNKEKLALKAKEYYKKNKQKIIERKMRWYRENREYALAYQKQYQEINKEELARKRRERAEKQRLNQIKEVKPQKITSETPVR